MKGVCFCSASGMEWSTPLRGCCPLRGIAMVVYCSSSTSLTVGILFLSWHSSTASPKTSVLLFDVCLRIVFFLASI